MFSTTGTVKKGCIALALFSIAVGFAIQTRDSSGHSGHSFSAAALVAPTIDGTKNAEEWDDADCQTNTVTMDNGEAADLTICVKNDDANLFMAIDATNQDYSDPGEPCYDFLRLHFDNEDDGAIGAGEDAVAIRFDNATTIDLYTTGIAIGHYQSDGADLLNPGTTNVSAAVTHSNPGANTIGTYTLEVAKPLDSPDDLHDFSLSYGNTVGFNFRMADGDPSPGGCGGQLGSFEWPSPLPTRSPGWADITIATPIPAGATPVEILLQPDGNPNSINCNAENKVIAVAVLTTDDFDATLLDQATVVFEGASETHADQKTGEPRRHEEDVDDDGDTDLVFHFRVDDTSLTCNSTKGVLVGKTFEGEVIVGIAEVDMIDQGK